MDCLVYHHHVSCVALSSWDGEGSKIHMPLLLRVYVLV